MLEIFKFCRFPLMTTMVSYHFQFTYYKLLMHDQGHTIVLFLVLILCFQLIIFLVTISSISLFVFILAHHSNNHNCCAH